MDARPDADAGWRLFVDADACPRVVRDIVVRAAEREQVATLMVANQLLRLPPSPWVQARQVPAGADAADDWIVQQLQAQDLVITGDIPLAARALQSGAQAISARGEVFDSRSIGQLLNMRDFMDSLRSSGVVTGGPPALSQADRQQFANQLDRWLQQRRRALAR